MIPYPNDTAFRQALEQRLINQARAEPKVPLVRLRKAIAFEALLLRLLRDQPDEWLLKGGFALQLRVGLQTRTTKDPDLRAAGSIDDAERYVRDAAQRDLGDVFTFEVGRSTTELMGAPGGGWRLPVRALLASRRFEEFHVDLGCGGPIVGAVQSVAGNSLLEALGYPAITVPLYPLATTVAEKVHAYTVPRLTGNMRVRDLVDLALMMERCGFTAQEVRRACAATFGTRAAHIWPPLFEPPPSSWNKPYRRLREETGIHPRTAGSSISGRFPYLPAVAALSAGDPIGDHATASKPTSTRCFWSEPAGRSPPW